MTSDKQNAKSDSAAVSAQHEAPVWVGAVIEQLDQSQEKLDYRTRLQLKAAREKALETASTRPASFQGSVIALARSPLKPVLFALPLLFALYFWNASPVSDQPSPVFEDIEILTSEADTELLEDLEFFVWLATSEDHG